MLSLTLLGLLINLKVAVKGDLEGGVEGVVRGCLWSEVLSPVTFSFSNTAVNTTPSIVGSHVFQGGDTLCS